MRRKTTVLLTLLLMCLFCQVAAAASVEISGIGTVELNDAISVKEAKNPGGGKDYKLLVKDGELWRGLRILAVASLPESGGLDPVFVLSQVLEEKGKALNIIELEEAKAISVNGRDGAEASLKMAVEGWVMNLKLVHVKNQDGLKMMAFACADGDTPYWRPIIRQIVESLK